jgi:hypothetical protein
MTVACNCARAPVMLSQWLSSQYHEPSQQELKGLCSGFDLTYRDPIPSRSTRVLVGSVRSRLLKDRRLFLLGISC